MTAFQDLFVGLVAVFVGCLLIGGAIFESRTLMGFMKSRLLVESVGKGGTRLILAAIGGACVAMGALIMSGWRVQW